MENEVLEMLLRKQLKRSKTRPPHRRQRCEDCNIYLADWPSRLCPGCEAYKEHQA